MSNGKKDKPDQPLTLTNPELPPEFLIIDRAIQKGCGPEVMRELVELKERTAKFIAEKAWMADKAACDADMPKTVLASERNNQTNSNYAPFEELQKLVKPIYTKWGFSLEFAEEAEANPEMMHIVADLSHKDGHTKRYHRWFSRDGKGPKGNPTMNAPQACKSTMSYAKRDMTEGIFGIAEGGDDKDGNNLPQVIDDEQLRKMNDLIDSCKKEGAPVADDKFLLFAFDVKVLDPELHKRELLPLRRYNLVMSYLGDKWKLAKAKKEAK